LLYTAGIDVGSNSIKTAVMAFDDRGGDGKILANNLGKIRKRDTKDVILQSFGEAISAAGIAKADVSYIATTGEGEMADFRNGHFYSMTSHARGAIFLNPDVRGAVDAGALHTKAFLFDSRSKVLSYKTTSQCASGSGQFLENISRYLGIPLEDVGELSISSDSPELVSSICAVLAETDVINMVSRGIAAGNILKGIHLSMAGRVFNLLRGLKANGNIMITGGLSNDKGYIAALRELEKAESMSLTFNTHPLSIFPGAIGASIWAAFRTSRLKEKEAKR